MYIYDWELLQPMFQRHVNPTKKSVRKPHVQPLLWHSGWSYATPPLLPHAFGLLATGLGMPPLAKNSAIRREIWQWCSICGPEKPPAPLFIKQSLSLPPRSKKYSDVRRFRRIQATLGTRDGVFHRDKQLPTWSPIISIQPLQSVTLAQRLKVSKNRTTRFWSAC